MVDLSSLPESQREIEAHRIATEDARNPISLDAAPLLRARVVRFSADEFRLFVTLHHIIFDAISIVRIFVPELTSIYAAFEQGHACPLSPPSLQYGDYAIWRERHVDSSSVERCLKYWAQTLSGELPVLQLPEDRPRPAILTYRGSMECFHLPTDLADKLRRLSHKSGVTLYVILLAVYKVMLFRYSGQNDLIVGTVSDSRSRQDLRNVIGYFLHTFAVRTRPSPGVRFSEFLEETRDAVLGGLASSEVPFDRVVQEVNPKRDVSRHPIFQTFFSVRPPMPSFADGWGLSQMDVVTGSSKFDLYLELCELQEKIEARFFYSTDLWDDASSIRRMAKHWLVLLESVCQNPDESLGMLPLLTAEDLEGNLGPEGWNHTSQHIPQLRVEAIIEEQARRTPHAIAVTFGSERWTYKNLDSCANEIARRLIRSGVGRGSIVALLMNRSLDLMAALVGILKAGAAYLPLDKQMPRDRIAACLTDAEPSAILTDRSSVGEVAYRACPIIVFDPKDRSTVGTDTAYPEVLHTSADVDDRAYVIYTSGTTGEPKAVEISQRSLLNLLTSMRKSPGFCAQDVLLAVTPISFDIAALELFLPLVCGGTVAIASREESLDPYLLTYAIGSSGCTVMQATPSTWRVLVNFGPMGADLSSWAKPPRLRRILCGGETLTPELANGLLTTGAEVWNMYGPTETSIWSLIYLVRPGIKDIEQIPVGCPIANTVAFILDAQRQILPVGIPGELFLGGAGLANGYLGRPEQTAERFIDVESVGGKRLYRTGDFALRRADGNIVVLGRIDNQVKVRGQRIELEAVEAAILRHPHVVSAAARAWPQFGGGMRLSAYVVSVDGATAPNLAEIRAFLANSVPESMIPSEVIPLSAIPLTPHGKIDRHRLPERVAGASEAPSPRAAPSTVEEIRLAAIWSGLLGLTQIGIDQSFFELGGHSILVASLQQRIAAEFGQRIPIVDLFQRHTLGQQARLLSSVARGEPRLWDGVASLNARGPGGGIFWIHSVQSDLANAIGDNRPFFSVMLTPDDIEGLGKAPKLQSIARCISQKILASRPSGPYILGGLCAFGILAYEVASQLLAAGCDVSLLVLLDAPNPAWAQSTDWLTRKLSYVPYGLKRATRLGLKVSLLYLGERLVKPFARMKQAESRLTEMQVVEDIVVAAALAYCPEPYDGSVLLLLASERPPYLDFLPGWQKVVRGRLHAEYLQGHHRDLLDKRNVRNVALAIVSHLRSANHRLQLRSSALSDIDARNYATSVSARGV
jgi:amino acid adenylation domain-containing protein